MISAKSLGLQAVKGAAGAADWFRPVRTGVTILIYHRIGGGSGTQVDMPPSQFADQLAFLCERYRPVTLDEALEALGQPGPDARDPVVVTFDDGTADFAEHAVPLLVDHGVPALLYVATAFVEDQRPFPDDGHPVSWAALRDCVTTGLVTLGSHTHTHALLDRVDLTQARAELDRSVGLIEDRAGVPAEHFAYPKAVAPAPAVEAEVRRTFRSAALAGTRANQYQATDPHHLARSPVQRADGVRWFIRKAAGGMALEDTLRVRLNRRRYAGEST